MKYIKKLYNWILSWADSAYAVPALFVLAFTGSGFFPIPPDFLLMALALSKGHNAYWYATVCTVGSILGALFGYLIGYAFWQMLGAYFFEYVPGFTLERFQWVCNSYEEYSGIIVFVAAVTPIPYYVFTVGAGVTKISIAPFLIASIIGRGGRFFTVAILLRYFGEKVKYYIEKYFDLLTLLIVIIYILANYLIPALFK